MVFLLQVQAMEGLDMGSSNVLMGYTDYSIRLSVISIMRGSLNVTVDIYTN